MKVLGWYVVDGMNHAVDAGDQDKARDLAAEWNNLPLTRRTFKPYRAVLLAEIDESEVTNNGTIISETLKHEAGRSIDIAKNNERLLKGRRK